MANKLNLKNNPKILESKIRKFYEIIRLLYPIKKMLLYGSYAQGNPRKDSDIDILVVVDLPNEADTIAITSRLFHYASEVDTAIEPFCISWEEYKKCEKGSILSEIKRTGISII